VPRRVASLLSLLFVLALPAAGALAAGSLTVRFVNVGQGDATVFEGPCGEIGVIDVPKGGHGKVLDALDLLGSRQLSWLTVSHFDADHGGGVSSLGTARDVSVDMVYDRGEQEHALTDTYKKYTKWIQRTDQPRSRLEIGETYSLCEGEQRVDFEVMSVAAGGLAAGGVRVSSENDRGVCLKITYIRFTMASCGDAGRKIERAIAESIGKADLVKVSHHGSRGSSDPAYVEALAPSASVLTVGKNSYGHPAPEVRGAWEAVSDVYQTAEGDGTDFDGDVIATTDGTESVRIHTTRSGRATTYPLAAAAPPGERRSNPNEEDGDIGEDLAIFGGTLLAVGLGIAIERWRRRERPAPASMTASPDAEEPPPLGAVFTFLDAARAEQQGSARSVTPHAADVWPPAREALLAIGTDHPDSEIREQARLLNRYLGEVARGDKEANLEGAETRVWRLVDRLRGRDDQTKDRDGPA
jgi:competence protein ComEC